MHILEKYYKNECVKVSTNLRGEGIVSASGVVPTIVLKMRIKHYLRKHFFFEHFHLQIMRCSDYFTKCFVDKRVKLPKIYIQRSKIKQKENKSLLSVVDSCACAL